MPTTRPRYTVTDTGDVREMLDLAQRRWPEVKDRRQLLLRLADAGRDFVAVELEASGRERRSERQQAALRRGRDLVDADALLTDTAWR
ncbi:MAG: hypothetical protein M3071_09120 [Actinomycetota bacterium]|nr:hypothetical protein [Actinomycetota bacterium]